MDWNVSLIVSHVGNCQIIALLLYEMEEGMLHFTSLIVKVHCLKFECHNDLIKFQSFRLILIFLKSYVKILTEKQFHLNY